MLGLGRKNDDVERIVYENEIKRLTKERNEFMDKYELANKYKTEYEELANEYRRKLAELDKMNKETDRLNHELRTMIEKVKR